MTDYKAIISSSWVEDPASKVGRPRRHPISHEGLDFRVTPDSIRELFFRQEQTQDLGELSSGQEQTRDLEKYLTENKDAAIRKWCNSAHRFATSWLLPRVPTMSRTDFNDVTVFLTFMQEAMNYHSDAWPRLDHIICTGEGAEHDTTDPWTSETIRNAIKEIADAQSIEFHRVDPVWQEEDNNDYGDYLPDDDENSYGDYDKNRIRWVDPTPKYVSAYSSHIAPNFNQKRDLENSGPADSKTFRLFIRPSPLGAYAYRGDSELFEEVYNPAAFGPGSKVSLHVTPSSSAQEAVHMRDNLLLKLSDNNSMVYMKDHKIGFMIL